MGGFRGLEKGESAVPKTVVLVGALDTKGQEFAFVSDLVVDVGIDKAVAIAAAAHTVRHDISVVCHGGPFDEPENVGRALPRMKEVAGFFGASSIKRLPTERAISAQVKAFKAIRRS